MYFSLVNSLVCCILYSMLFLFGKPIIPVYVFPKSALKPNILLTSVDISLCFSHTHIVAELPGKVCANSLKAPLIASRSPLGGKCLAIEFTVQHAARTKSSCRHVKFYAALIAYS